jgi:hypothetical protein
MVCTVCRHPKLLAIDRLLLKREQLKLIARRYHLGEDAVGRHRRHMRTAMLKAAALKQEKTVAYGVGLLQQVEAVKRDAERLQLECEDGRDLRAALAALKQRLEVIELEAKLTGELDGHAQHNELHVHLTPDRALAVAETYIARHGVVQSLAEMSLQIIEGTESIAPTRPTLEASVDAAPDGTR